MKYIKKDNWKKLLDEFYKKAAKQDEIDVNKGILFETLVESLLQNMFEDRDMIFQSTKASHDGSKDFWAVDEGETLWWAECKNYTPSISLTQLAPTLIMAELNNVQHLLFFSYSKLNDNLKRRIGQYAYEHQKEVFVYEDELLEELMFENMKEDVLSILALDNLTFHTDRGVETLFFNEKNPNQLDQKNFNGYYEIEKLSVGGIYNLNAIIVNGSQPCEIKVSIEETKDLPYFELLTSEKGNKCEKQKILHLVPNQLQMCKFTVRLVKYKKRLTLPKLIVETMNNKTARTYSLPTVEYDCIWNRKDVFIGKNYEDVISIFTKACINKFRISGFIVYGNGGTGKTRILEECTAVLLKNNYKVLNFIGFDTNSSWKDIVREITYSAFAISEDLKIDIICNMDCIVTPLMQDKEKEGIITLLRLLNKRDFNEEFAQDYYMILFEKLRRDKYAIVVDNLQSYSQEVLGFFNRMIQFLLQCQGETKLILLFSINTALVFEPEYFNFINEFERVNFKTEHIDGFQDENQAIAFLKTILRLDDYPLNYLTMKKVLSHTSLKPKYIEQIANYLIQKGCIELKDGKGVVVDSTQLKKELENIPQSFEILFSSSYHLLLEKCPICENDFEKALSLLYLFSELDEYIIDLFQINQKAISALVTHNIIIDIKASSVHTYKFEHDLIEQCFINLIYPNLLEMALEHFEELKSNDKDTLQNFKVQYSLCGLYRKTFSADELKRINRELPDLNIPNKFLNKFYYYFVNNMIAHKDDYSFDIFIKEVLNSCKYVRDHISEVEAEKIFDLAYPHIFEIQLCDQKVIEQHFSFVIHYCENKNRLKDVTCAVNTYNKYAQKLGQLLETNPELKEKVLYAQAYINNRIFVCGKLEGELERYQENLNWSIEVSTTYKFEDILFEDYFDASNVYFFKETDIEKGMCLLEKGFESFFKMSPDSIRKFKVNYYSKKILYYMIRKNYRNALDKTNEALEYIKNNNAVNYHIFFKCRYLKYKMICLMLLDEINSFLDEVYDEYERILQIVNKKDDLERYFLQAKYAYFNKNKENFAMLFENYYYKVSNANKDNNYIRDVHMLEDLAIKYRILFPARFFQGINSRAKPLYEVNKILHMSDEEFQQFCSMYKSSAPIVDMTGKDGYFI